jgi:transcriptional regulator with XRE-family HTH domain
MAFDCNALRKARENAKFTHESLAIAAGVDSSTIYFLESGRTPNPRTDTVQRLAHALSVDMAALLGAPLENKRTAPFTEEVA